MIRQITFLFLLSLVAACNDKLVEGNNSSTSSDGIGGAFESGFRKTYRTEFVEQCQTAFKTEAPGLTGVPVEKVCACAADEIIKRKSIRELMSGPGDRESEAIMDTCLEKTDAP